MKALSLFLVLTLAALPAAAKPAFRALVFSKTAGFRHDSIPDGIAAIRKLGAESNFAVDATEDAAAFTDANLARYKVVVFLNTTGTVLDPNQKSAFERYIGKGAGFAGVHAASDTEYEWKWYDNLVGAHFLSHPAIQDGLVKVEDRTFPAASMLPADWRRRDEWYSFRANPRQRVHVLAALDETSIQGGAMGGDHPLCWYREFDGGRSFYTAMGHTKESYTEPLFLQSLLGGIRWAAGQVRADGKPVRRKSRWRL
ncbi:MAG TPA: ThuA domain-containing protein [Armatimonadota bacterium]|jgi:type 1 glutamine amidotransferase